MLMHLRLKVASFQHGIEVASEKRTYLRKLVGEQKKFRCGINRE